MTVVTVSAKRARRYASVDFRKIKRSAHRKLRRKVRIILKGSGGEDVQVAFPPLVTWKHVI